MTSVWVLVNNKASSHLLSLILQDCISRHAEEIKLLSIPQIHVSS